MGIQPSPSTSLTPDAVINYVKSGRSPASHVRFWLTALGLLLLDLWSKHKVFRDLGPDEIYNVIPKFLVFRRSLNAGAVFGSFSGYSGVFILASVLALFFVLYVFLGSRQNQRVLHVSLGLILAGALGNLYDRAFIIADVANVRNQSGRTFLVIGRRVQNEDSLRVHIGDWPTGGNPQSYPTDDVQLSRQGVVRDFLHFEPKFPPWVPKLGGTDVWPWIFNVADAALVVGVALLLLISLREKPPKPVTAGMQFASTDDKSTVPG